MKITILALACLVACVSAGVHRDAPEHPSDKVGNLPKCNKNNVGSFHRHQHPLKYWECIKDRFFFPVYYPAQRDCPVWTFFSEKCEKCVRNIFNCDVKPEPEVPEEETPVSEENPIEEPEEEETEAPTEAPTPAPEPEIPEESSENSESSENGSDSSESGSNSSESGSNSSESGSSSSSESGSDSQETPAESGEVEPTDAPVPEDSGEVEPTDAPAPEDSGEVEPTDAPAPEDSGEVEPTDAPAPEDSGEVEPTDAPAPEDSGEVEPTDAPAPEDSGEVEPTDAPVKPTDAPVDPEPCEVKCSDNVDQEKGEYHADPESCAHFYQCAQAADFSWYPVRHECPAGLIWNPNANADGTGACDWASNYQCTEKPGCPAPEPEPTPCEKPVCSEHVDQEKGEYHANPESCSSFYQCAQAADFSWYPALHECPSGLEFNAALNVCDWPEDAKCKVTCPTNKGIFF